MAVRKRATKMTSAEKQRFRDVITTLINNGTYGQLVSHHADMSHNMHSMNPVGQQRFLPWHRVYLLKLEQAMQAIDPLCFIPYWKWTTQRKVPPWLETFLPTVNVPGTGNITVTRNVGVPPPLPTTSAINSVLSETTYTDFTAQLEGQHDDAHVWVGGTMSVISTAPSDPLFWLHHAQIDRLWSVWQAKASNAGKNPSLTGSNRIMDPWTETEEQIRSITALGYSYGP
ncbi:MAG: tyrosinase family protein [Candidatus Binatia bacterium]